MRRAIAIAAAFVLGGCRAAPDQDDRRKVDEGYLLGSADAVKQLYWAKQALEAPRATTATGRMQYYIWEESGTARDGRKLAPEQVAVPVFVPAPAPSGGPGP